MQFRSTVRQSAYTSPAVEPTPVVPVAPDGRTRKPRAVPKHTAPAGAPGFAARVRDALIALHEYKSAHIYLGRYSVDKLVRFDHYCHSASPWRVAAVILATPAPVVAIMLVFQAVPLADPARGAAHNWRLFPWSICAHVLLSLSTLAPLKQALRFSDAIYSTRTLVGIACFAAVTNELLWAVPAFLWKFPVPLRELVAGTTWTALLALGHWLFARRLVRSKWGRLRKYLPIAGAQFVLFFAFLGLALVFGRLSRALQFAWILLFPCFKLAMKKWLWQYARRLDDISTDVTVCLVEIAGALYQSVCMQLMESVAAALVLMGMDFAQAAVEVWMYTHHGFLVDGASTISTAVKIVESSLFPGSTEEPGARAISPSPSPFPQHMRRRLTWHGAVHGTDRASLARTPRNSTTATESTVTTTTTTTNTSSSSGHGPSRRPSRRHSCPNVYVTKSPNSVFMAPADYERRSTSRRRLLNLRRHSVVRARDSVTTVGTSSTASCSGSDVRFTGVHALVKHETSVQIDNLLVKRKDQARILEQALQLLFSCEVLIFVEYVEVAMPLVYTTIATAAWFLPNAKYNTMICMLPRDQLLSGMGFTVGYALLETLTFVAMCLFMHRKFGVSTLYQLAFVLESYALTIQGKLIGSFIVIVNLAIVHQGVNVTVLTGASLAASGCGVHGAQGG